MSFHHFRSLGEVNARAAVHRAAERLSPGGQRGTFGHDLVNLLVLLRRLPRRLRRLLGR